MEKLAKIPEQQELDDLEKGILRSPLRFVYATVRIHVYCSPTAHRSYPMVHPLL